MTDKKNKKNRIGTGGDHHKRFVYRFDLVNRIDPKQTIKGPMSYDEINQYVEGIPILHLAQHKLTYNENIDPYYKKQLSEADQAIDLPGSEDQLSPEDEELFVDIEKAINEKDILNLRDSLSHILKSEAPYPYSSQELNQYLDQELDKNLTEQITQELDTNLPLADDLNLYQEIDVACQEKDIMNLRAQLQQITENERAEIPVIDRYVDNDLEETERFEFEQELVLHPDWQNEVDLQQEITAACQEKDIMDLRDQLQIIQKQNDTDTPQERSIFVRIPHRKIVSTAVAASLLLFAGTSIYEYKSKTDLRSLYHEYYTPYSASLATRSGNVNDEQLLNHALAAYNSGNFDLSLQNFNKILEKNSLDPVANFYTAMCYQQTDKYTKALDFYNKVIRENDNLFVEQSEWYSSLCLMKSGEKEKAITRLNQISHKKGFYATKAQTLLKQLE